MIAANMRMICKFILQRGDFEVMDVERELSAFDDTGGSLKGIINQNEGYSLANVRVRSVNDSYLAMVTHQSEILPTGKRKYFTPKS
jgi:hypothetical protein